MEKKTLTSQEAELKRHEREANKWASRKARWDAWKRSQKAAK